MGRGEAGTRRALVRRVADQDIARSSAPATLFAAARARGSRFAENINPWSHDRAFVDDDMRDTLDGGEALRL